ncbi:sialate O-acetylesterase [Hymenobacter armeniacus]|uniref:Sialate O-acetylesterase n=1 Tax=Hymenobacter armeniacus TaxID=2771358 RepID=A0ABR8JVX2_9BACT|nr:sialate O-acetylesterase [Hymenobacter armeniacus]MBD2723103.1 sialate O-acetylesterase [Hymenobacter armeniacus]
MYKRITLLLFISAWLGASVAQATVRLPRLISDGMVLQRGQPLKVWGWGAPGEAVAVTFQGKTLAATTGPDGKWTINLGTFKAGGPYTLSVKGTNELTIKDVLVGDVWFASGQSNMEFPMRNLKEKYATEIAQSTNPKIRQFLVTKKHSFTGPLDDVASDGWKNANPENVLAFTAVGYFFAKDLYDKYKVPVGLIHSSWGGTPAEAWISPESLKPFEGYAKAYAKVQDPANVKAMLDKNKVVSEDWYRAAKAGDQGRQLNAPAWFQAPGPEDAWKPITVPGYWEQQGVKEVDGIVWYKKEVEVPATAAGQPAELILGYISNQDSTYFNGQFVGWMYDRYNLRKYKVPANLVKPGKNVITVRVINTEENGGFIPDKPYQLQLAGATIDLKGEWKYRIGVATPPMGYRVNLAYQPAGLYNGMVAPVTNYAIKGVIWYQGESNARKAYEYQKLFPALITDWRARWQQGDFPFLYVQLANYLPAKDQPGESTWAELREAQTMTLALPATGMATIHDIGEWNDIHPLNKKDVGARLALAAEHVAYQDKKVVYSGPVYQRLQVEGGKAVLSFANTGGGLMVKKGDKPLAFAIAGADKKFVWADAKIEGDKVVVWSKDVPQPVAVRYAWADNPDQANLYNKQGLPAISFRTDTWPGLTVGVK